MDDDFNTAGALGNIFDLVRGINQARDAGAGDDLLKPAQSVVRELCGVLGLHLDRQPSSTVEAVPFIELLISLRAELRVQQNWAMADRVRDQLANLGVTLEDSKEGTVWRKG
jgi:cysteinyl-tRNA synthetase